MGELLFKDECYALQGAIFEVNREMGAGFLEAVYQECLAREFARMNIPFVAHQELVLSYKGKPLAQTYKPDFVCYGKIILELKATQDLAIAHKAQVLNYLKATQFRLGLLVNFGTYPNAHIERIII
jgi:GxxExxY protein